jgi:hypothetical protein
VLLDDAANTMKKSVAVWRDTRPFGRAKKRTDQIVNYNVNVKLTFPVEPVIQACALKELAKQMGCQAISRPTDSPFGFEGPLHHNLPAIPDGVARFVVTPNIPSCRHEFATSDYVSDAALRGNHPRAGRADANCFHSPARTRANLVVSKRPREGSMPFKGHTTRRG